MKSIRFIIPALMTFIGTAIFAQEKTDSFKVYGNCGMCKKRIEKAVKTDAVSYALWDVNSKIMTITYDSSRISNDELQKRIAVVGHDTEKFIADDKVYEKLPGCCLYDRKVKKGKDNDANKQR